MYTKTFVKATMADSRFNQAVRHGEDKHGIEQFALGTFTARSMRAAFARVAGRGQHRQEIAHMVVV